MEMFILLSHQPGLAFALENAVRLCYSTSQFSLVIQALLLNHKNELLQRGWQLFKILDKVTVYLHAVKSQENMLLCLVM